MLASPDPLNVFWNRCAGPVAYGVNDCCMAIADTILAAGGPDLLEGYRDRYRSRPGFIRAFRGAGFKTLREAAVAMLAAKGVPVDDEPRAFDVAVIPYYAVRQIVHSPAFFHGGYWNLRTDRGMASLAHQDGVEIWRVLHA